MNLLSNFVLLSGSELVDTINKINDFIAGKILVTGLLFAGLFLSFILGFPQITKLGKAFKLVFGGLFKKKEGPKEEGSMSSFQALATAVAAQVGTGNVAGVATAITAGGTWSDFLDVVISILWNGNNFRRSSFSSKVQI